MKKKYIYIIVFIIIIILLLFIIIFSNKTPKNKNITTNTEKEVVTKDTNVEVNTETKNEEVKKDEPKQEDSKKDTLQNNSNTQTNTNNNNNTSTNDTPNTNNNSNSNPQPVQPAPTPTYSCPDGYDLNGTKCTSVIAANVICPDGSWPYTNGKCIDTSNGHEMTGDTCPEGEGMLGHSSFDAPTYYLCHQLYDSTYSCDDGYQLNNNLCTKTIDAIAH